MKSLSETTAGVWRESGLVVERFRVGDRFVDAEGCVWEITEAEIYSHPHEETPCDWFTFRPTVVPPGVQPPPYGWISRPGKEVTRLLGLPDDDPEALRRVPADDPAVSHDEFRPGDPVRKKAGYEFPGTVVSRFVTTQGKVRYVVEHRLSRGLLHVFSGEQLEREE